MHTYLHAHAYISHLCSVVCLGNNRGRGADKLDLLRLLTTANSLALIRLGFTNFDHMDKIKWLHFCFKLYYIVYLLFSPSRLRYLLRTNTARIDFNYNITICNIRSSKTLTKLVRVGDLVLACLLAIPSNYII